MAYNFDKKTCDVCGITKKELKEKVNGLLLSYADYCRQAGFCLSLSGSVLCPVCSKEKNLKKLFGS